MQSGSRLPLSRRGVRQDSRQWWRKLAGEESLRERVACHRTVEGPSQISIESGSPVRKVTFAWAYEIPWGAKQVSAMVRLETGERGEGGTWAGDVRKDTRCLSAALAGAGPSSHVLNPQSLAEALARPDGEQ
jgi:hypothetical protein